jgi:hypothetical protein
MRQYKQLRLIRASKLSQGHSNEPRCPRALGARCLQSPVVPRASGNYFRRDAIQVDNEADFACRVYGRVYNPRQLALGRFP